MKPESVIVEKVCFAPAQLAPPSLPEVAIIGRSNVGKSSLINRVLGKKGLMRVSNTPGRTRGIFFVNLSGKGYLVDLPGFGYAKISQATKRSWAELVEAYLHRKAPGGALLLVDIRRDPSDGDTQMADWFRYYGKPFAVIMTKADKISRGHWRGRAEALRKGLALEPGQVPIPFSAVTGEGADKISHLIRSYMERRSDEQNEDGKLGPG